MAEKLMFNIPANSEWDIAAVDARAAELGFSNRSEMMIYATDLLMNIDKNVFGKIRTQAKRLHIQDYLVIQNYVIKHMAERAAEIEVYGPGTKVLHEFLFVDNGEGPTCLTGEDLFEHLKAKKVREIKNSDSYKNWLHIQEEIAKAKGEQVE